MVQPTAALTDEPEAPLATTEQVAEFLGTTTGALAQQRHLGAGPEYIKLGHRTIRYRWAAVIEYVNAGVVSTGRNTQIPA